VTNGRTKGAAFERQIAQLLHLHLGINFKRDIEQYRAADHGDLICDAYFPFVIECKRYADGPIGGKPEWWGQADKAARAMTKLPCLIYKYDRKPIRVVITLEAIVLAIDPQAQASEDGHVEMDIETFCYIARELIA
jgi:hypothetical protein